MCSLCDVRSHEWLLKHDDIKLDVTLNVTRHVTGSNNICVPLHGPFHNFFMIHDDLVTHCTNCYSVICVF
jgi:hypothetical protein